MQKIKTILTAFGFSAALFAAAPVFADGHLEKAIEARQAVMKLYSFNLGQLGAGNATEPTPGSTPRLPRWIRG